MLRGDHDGAARLCERGLSVSQRVADAAYLFPFLVTGTRALLARGGGFVGVAEEQLREAHERDLAVEDTEGVHFEHAWLDPVQGKVFCLSSGPSKEAVQRIHEKAGHRTTEVYELSVDIT